MSVNDALPMINGVTPVGAMEAAGSSDPEQAILCCLIAMAVREHAGH